MYNTKPIPQYSNTENHNYSLYMDISHNIEHGPDQLDAKEHHANKH